VQRVLVRTAIVASLILPASVVIPAVSAGAKKAQPSNVTCASFKTVEDRNAFFTDIGKCKSVAGAGYRSATVWPGTLGQDPTLNGLENGTIDWNGGASTTIGSANADWIGNYSSNDICPRWGRAGGGGELVDGDTLSVPVTAASTSGPGIPAVGEVLTVELCYYDLARAPSSVGSLIQTGTTLTFSFPPPPITTGDTYTFTSNCSTLPSFSETFNADGTLAGSSPGTWSTPDPESLRMTLTSFASKTDDFYFIWAGSEYNGVDSHSGCQWLFAPS
jgi:hypothetical protein